MTLACFSAAGTTPVVREELIVLVRKGIMSGEMVWSREEGIGSRGHVVARLDEISFRVSASVRTEKEDKVKGSVSGSSSVGGGVCGKELRMSSTFPSKKDANSSAEREDGGGGAGGVRREERVENSLRWSEEASSIFLWKKEDLAAVADLENVVRRSW